MNYLLLANPREWKEGNPNKFDEFGKVSYAIHRKNSRYLSEAKIGERALLLINDKERMIKFEAFVSNYDLKNQEVEFTYKRTIKPFKIDILKIHPQVNEILFTKNGDLKQNSVFGVDDYLFDEIIQLGDSPLNRYMGDEKSRKFFDRTLRTIEGLSSDRHIRGLDWNYDFIENDNKFDNTTKIMSLAQLKSDKESNKCETDKREVMEIIQRYGERPIIEGIEIEQMAFYKSYHRNNLMYGIYFNLKKFSNYIISTEKLLNRQNNFNHDFNTVRDICVEKVLQHERFHYLTELFITFEEISSKNSSIYRCFDDVYEDTFLHDNCYAEALANYFAKMYFIHKGKKKYVNELNEMFRMQAPGYREAANINETNENEKFTKFEEQIENALSNMNNNCRNIPVKLSGMFREVSELYLKERLPLAQLEIDGKMNIPVYIINDGMTEADFNKLLKLVFPRV